MVEFVQPGAYCAVYTVRYGDRGYDAFQKKGAPLVGQAPLARYRIVRQRQNVAEKDHQTGEASAAKERAKCEMDQERSPQHARTPGDVFRDIGVEAGRS